MIREKLYRPSLKITRHADQRRTTDYSFEVWSPFTGTYQTVDSIEDGMRRVAQLAGLLREMWLRQHPMHHALTDTPDTVATDTAEWAEFRINATTTYPSYDTRHRTRPHWMRASGLDQATETTCATIDCARPRSGRQERHDR